MSEPPSPALKPLRIALAVTAVATLVTLVLAGLAGCHDAGWM